MTSCHCGWALGDIAPSCGLNRTWKNTGSHSKATSFICCFKMRPHVFSSVIETLIDEDQINLKLIILFEPLICDYFSCAVQMPITETTWWPEVKSVDDALRPWGLTVAVIWISVPVCCNPYLCDVRWHQTRLDGKPPINIARVKSGAVPSLVLRGHHGAQNLLTPPICTPAHMGPITHVGVSIRAMLWRYSLHLTEI